MGTKPKAPKPTAADEAIIVRQGLQLDEEIAKKYDLEQVNNKIKWVCNFREALHQWNDILKITISTESFVRERGLYYGADVDLSKGLPDVSSDSKVEKIKNVLIETHG